MTNQNETSLLPCDLHNLFSYEAETGNLIWKRKESMNFGKVVGCKDTNGRIRCEINGKSYSVHRIIFCMHHGRWPKYQIDHINQIKTDNRIENPIQLQTSLLKHLKPYRDWETDRKSVV